MTTLILSINVRKVHQSHRNTTQISLEAARNSLLFGIGLPCRSSEFEDKMLEETSCSRTRCCKLCVAPTSRTKTTIRRFRASAVDFIFFTDELVWQLVDDILNTWSDRLLCFAFISNWLSLAADFAALCLCQQWPFLAYLLLWLQLNTTHQYKIWNACFVANFLCCNMPNIFKIGQQHTQ